jgi:hypothetical protein
MAADLIEKSNIPHTFVYDLESVFWVLIWVVISFMHTEWEGSERLDFLKETMSPRVYGGKGRSTKKNFIMAKRTLPVPNVPNVERLHFVLSTFLASRYAQMEKPIAIPKYAIVLRNGIDKNVVMVPNEDSDEDPNEEAPNEAPKEDPQLQARNVEVYKDGLKDHAHIINMFVSALNLPGWPRNVIARPQSKLPSSEDMHYLRASSKRLRSVAEKNSVFV